MATSSIDPIMPDDSEEFCALVAVCQHIHLNRLDSNAFVFDDWFLKCLASGFETNVTRVEREMIRALVTRGLLEKKTIRDGAGKIAGHRYRVPDGCIWVLDECAERTDPALRVPEGQERAEPADALDPVAATKAYHVEKLSALVSDPALAHRVDLLATAYTRQAEYHAKLLRGQRVSEKDIRHVDKMIESGRKALGLDIDSKAKARASLAKSLETISPGRLLSDYRNEVERASEAQLEAMRLEEERALEDLQARIDANARRGE